MEPNQYSAAEIIRKLAGVKVVDVEGVPTLVAPADFQIKQFPNLLAAPRQIERSVLAHDIPGFTGYVNRFKDERTMLFAATSGPQVILGYLDYHKPGQASHVKHQVKLALEFSEEWQRWFGQNKIKKTQSEFGAFLEDNLKDVLEPRGSDLLAVAMNFSSMRSVEFKSAQRLQDGLVQLQYVENDKAGEAKLPETIVIGIPVFRGDREKAYKIRARLKVRVKDADLTIWYELDRPDLVVDAAYADVLIEIEQATGIKPIHGAA